MKPAVFIALGIATHLVALTRAQLTGWFPCPDDQPHSNLSCAYFGVPLDYHNASAGNGHLLVVKANATSGGKKGTVFHNPGGPGGSGLQALQTDAEALMNRTGGTYDIVSWDPRGVGPYTYPGGVFCLSDGEFFSFWNGTIEATGINWLGNFTNQTDLDNLNAQAPIIDAKYKEFAEKCLQGPNGTTLQYIGTAATVRDLVGLADAIEGPNSPIFYWGLSYGTIIGAWFVNMFPDRVGRVILDGVVDATRVATTQSYKLWRDQVSSAEDVYSAFANACAMAGPTGCNLTTFAGASGADVIDYLSQAFEGAYLHPLEMSFETLNDLRTSVFIGLYAPQYWEEYADVIIPGIITDLVGSLSTTTTQTRMRHVLDIIQPGSYTEPAILCADSVDADPSLTIQDIFAEIVNVTQTVSPSFGALWPIACHRCSYWPVRAPERYQGPFNNRTYANKVLIIGNTYDDATPFFEAQHMAEVMGDQAALVRQDGFGHTSLAESSQCVTDIIIAYLKDGTLPAGTASAPTVCAVDDSVELFPGVKSVNVQANRTISGRGGISNQNGTSGQTGRQAKTVAWAQRIGSLASA
ncbi:alpha/beta-hydrolase [Lentinus tigrinus ALCF2SS1-6]|uniref:Alpha/beta-hydrolase n=1 Tax=Lentinus tigrinus ALCF2SS1-6 TaxID=1328759 RepID=A0A5C2RN46_9APHY|nr:alpha/beta-hydrolase [Lentinus tigrinus ALCF2SS1-6]